MNLILTSYAFMCRDPCYNEKIMPHDITRKHTTDLAPREVPSFPSEQQAREWFTSQLDAVDERYQEGKRDILNFVRSWTDWKIVNAQERLSGGYRLWLTTLLQGGGGEDVRILVEHVSNDERIHKFATRHEPPAEQEVAKIIELALDDIAHVIVERVATTEDSKDSHAREYSVIAGEKSNESWTRSLHVTEGRGSADDIVDAIRKVVAQRRAEADTHWHAYRDALDGYRRSDPAERGIYEKIMSDATDGFKLHFSQLYDAYEHLEEYYYHTFSWDDPQVPDAVRSVRGLDQPLARDTASRMDSMTKRMPAWLRVKLGDLGNFATAIEVMKQVAPGSHNDQIETRRPT